MNNTHKSQYPKELNSLYNTRTIVAVMVAVMLHCGASLALSQPTTVDSCPCYPSQPQENNPNKEQSPNYQKEVEQVDPLLIVTPSQQGFAPNYSMLESPEVFNPDEKIDIYLLPQSDRFASCKITIINPQGEVSYENSVLPVKSEAESKQWPKISLSLSQEGNFRVIGDFIGKDGETKTASTSILVNSGKTKIGKVTPPCEEPETNETKETQGGQEGVQAQILANILDSLEEQNLEEPNNKNKLKEQISHSFQPPYSQQEVFETIKAFFKEASKDNYSPSTCPQRAKILDLANCLDNQEAARWIIQSLPLWRDIEDASPASQLCKRAAQLARPDDLALLANLLECQIDQGAKLWGLSLLSNVSSPINTDFLQALVLEGTLQPNSDSEADNWSMKNAATEALTKMGSRRSVLFLFDLLEDDRVNQNDSEAIELALATLLPATQEVVETLQRISEETDVEQAQRKELALDLINTLEGEAMEGLNREE
jgi:hypothetical protein